MSKSTDDSSDARVSQPTKGGGDCAFHAALGEWNSSTGQFEAKDIPGKRKEVADAIKACTSDSILFPLIKKAIWQLVIEDKPSLRGEVYKGFKRAYQDDANVDPFSNESIDPFFEDVDLLNEYADFISTTEQWLLPCELQIIAYVFDISIEYYATASATPELFNPGRPNSVCVCFVGNNHYERMTKINNANENIPTAATSNFSTPVKKTSDSASSTSTPSSSDSSQKTSPGGSSNPVSATQLAEDIKKYYSKQSASLWKNICQQAHKLFPSISRTAFVESELIVKFEPFKEIYIALLWMAFSGKTAQYRKDANYILQQLHGNEAFKEMSHQLMYANSNEAGLQKLLEDISKWNDLYRDGIEETKDKVLLKRQELAFSAAQEIGKLLNKFGTPLSSEKLSEAECYILMKAVANSNNVKTPFYNAFKLLAIQRGQTVDKLCDVLLDGYTKCEPTVTEPSVFPAELQQEMRELRFHMNYSKASSEGIPERITENAAWNHLQAKCCDPGKYRLTDDDITMVLTMFDQQCYIAPDINKLVSLFAHVFEEMMSRFNDQDHYVTSGGWWGSTRVNIPVDFKRYTDLIAPKDPDKPPYAFALFWYYFCQQDKSVALKHEKEYLQKYLVRLEVYRNELNEINFNGEKLADCVAPINPNENSPKCPLDLIYDQLWQEVENLYKKGTRLTSKEIQPYKDIFTDHNGVMRNMKTNKDKDNLLFAMINRLSPVDHNMLKRNLMLAAR